MGVVHITSEAEFNRAISSNGLVVCDWFAEWCGKIFVKRGWMRELTGLIGPCKAIAPRLEQMSTKYKEVKFIKVDVDELSVSLFLVLDRSDWHLVQTLAQSYSIQAMPTFHFYSRGQKLDEVIGASVAEVEHKIYTLSKAAGSNGGAFTGTGRVLGTGESVKNGSTPSPSAAAQLAVKGWNSTNIFIALTVLYLMYRIFIKSQGKEEF